MSASIQRDSALVPGDRKPAARDAEDTQRRLLAAAKTEFAKSGLAGARVDAIAKRAKINKRMIYHYFGSKERLFTAVLEEAWADIRGAEQRLRLNEVEPLEALARLAQFTWQYYLDNPEFITLVNSENLHKARHVKASARIREMSRPFVSMVQDILDRGVEAGVFRSGIDPVHLNITIAAIGYYYLTNRFTGSIVFERDLMAKPELDRRLAFNLDTILRLVLADPKGQKPDINRSAS